MKKLSMVKGLVISVSLFHLLTFSPLMTSAQERRPCIRNIPADVSKTRGMVRLEWLFAAGCAPPARHLYRPLRRRQYTKSEKVKK